ncbi:LysR family transcriptional regulator [Chondrinema litorale]|uniref:LysR family transcriptional regulator n=1 Tax=Chondrinema litorale TaxID=2994555 RepID=UPI002543B61F|nr:LysR substrate-binding domain-containing protein [Chondrinema litorale]UZR95883.1 LysR substrate-binding domain-containing protein [Chondrinema litorale]
MITLIQLEYVIAVDTYRHFAKAAQKCFVTQPTLSMQIKKLEEHLGIIIFDRSKQPVMPTDIGKEIIEQSRIILRESEKIPQIINSFENFVSGEVKIGITPTIGPYLIPKITGSFMKKYPGVSLYFKELVPDQLFDEIKKDLIDGGIIATPTKDDSLETRSLFYEEIMIYANPSHPFCNKESIDIKELENSNLLNIKGLKEEVLQLFTYQNQNELYRSEKKVLLKYESGSLEALKRMVDKEGGYTFLPELAINLIENEKKNQLIRFKSSTPLREIKMVSNKISAKSRLIDLLAKHIKNCLPPHLLQKERGQLIKT